MRLAIAALACAGCGNLLGIDGLSGPSDASADAVSDGALATRQISGNLRRYSGTLEPHTIEVRTPGSGVLARATTGLDGAYALDIPNAGPSLDAILEIPSVDGTDPNLFVYLGPVTADVGGVQIDLFSRADLDALATEVGQATGGTMGTLIVEVRDGLPGTGVAGAQLHADAFMSQVYYSNGVGPVAGYTETGPDGRVYLFNAKPNKAAVTTTGAISLSHQVDVGPDNLYELVLHP